MEISWVGVNCPSGRRGKWISSVTSQWSSATCPRNPRQTHGTPPPSEFSEPSHAETRGGVTDSQMQCPGRGGDFIVIAMLSRSVHPKFRPITSCTGITTPDTKRTTDHPCANRKYSRSAGRLGFALPNRRAGGGFEDDMVKNVVACGGGEIHGRETCQDEYNPLSEMGVVYISAALRDESGGKSR